MVTRLHRAGVLEVAIERPDGPVVDALLEAGLTVFVIAPKQIKNIRGRYGSAGNKDDRYDPDQHRALQRVLDQAARHRATHAALSAHADECAFVALNAEY